MKNNLISATFSLLVNNRTCKNGWKRCARIGGKKMAVRMIKVFLVITLVMVVLTMRLLRNVNTAETEFQERPLAKKKFLKIVHIDLKGSPPKMSFLLSLLPFVKRAGANALLIEYEDMFPYAGELVNISSKAPYTFEEVKTLVSGAESEGMEVIPLVQTFGHLEYVLKLEEFRILREVDRYPMEICPSRDEAVLLVKEMIRQVMEVHKNAKYLHIGCDEVRHLGKCPVCSRTNPRKIFSRHVYRIGSFVRATYPGVVPLIWDDMMRRWSIHDVQDSVLVSSVEPVVWVYGEDIPHQVPHYLWYVYFKNFPRIWAASAFKGATGETEVVPSISRHFENNLSWMKFIKNREDRVDTSPEIFGGIILTGWSRYDHFAVLCELLPASIPSLVLNLILVDRNLNIPDGPVISSDRSIFQKWLQLLRCPHSIPEPNSNTIKSRHYQALLGNCDFPGVVIYRLAFEYLLLKERLEVTVRDVEKSAWASPYNIRNNFTSPWRVSQILSPDFEEVVFKSLGLLKSSFYDAMTEFYEDFVIREWIEQNISPFEDKMNLMYKNLRNLMDRNVWPRRPLS